MCTKEQIDSEESIQSELAMGRECLGLETIFNDNYKRALDEAKHTHTGLKSTQEDVVEDRLLLRSIAGNAEHEVDELLRQGHGSRVSI